ncbi:MAG: EAL domain-containing protein, partial [Gallionella sp.]
MNNPQHDLATLNALLSSDEHGRVTAHYQDCSISSVYQPIFSLSHRRPVGYEALSRISRDGSGVLAPSAFFRQSRQESDNVMVDRLCRALHMRNFAGYQDSAWIFLNVNPLVTVLGKNYGSFFKELLESNHIAPGQVVVEILENGIYDETILAAAVDYYKDLGCLIALDDFGAAHSNFDRIWNLQPDIVKFDRSIVQQAEASRKVRKALPGLVALIQELGCLTLMESVETEPQALIAMDANVDLVQGYYFGYPSEYLVNADYRSDIMLQLTHKHAGFAADVRRRNQLRLESPQVEFARVLQQLKLGSARFEQACARLLALDNVMRIYCLDEHGDQIGGNIGNEQTLGRADPR